jgi:hypothetical protein
MKHPLLRALALLLLLGGAGAPLARGSFLWFGEHRYLHNGRYYAHRKWIPANENFAGFYQYWQPVAPPPPRRVKTPTQ